MPHETNASELHQRLVGLLDEHDVERGRAFAVAAAGRTYVGERDINARALFEVIEEMEADAFLTNTIRTEIDALAKLAGSNWTPTMEASHG